MGMSSGVMGYIQGLWIAVGIVWLAAALGAKQATRTQPVATRAAHLALMITAFSLLFYRRLEFGVLAWRVVPAEPALAWVGVVLTAAGCAIAIWARVLLGGNWSATVTVKQDHRLVRRGPYAVVRHPIYSGGLLGLLGTALALGELRGFLGLALAFAGWWNKSRIEERFMTEQFGNAYIEYEREVKALIPFVL
ncbi:MAG TPA: isoprenylcysteine carboxylmethyltransferase family protein [Bryobacteraceae bacterium]|nr:isoprenylcysteine carboxylmethyltransferase family protein [Bryobacteraceae bacterium]